MSDIKNTEDELNSLKKTTQGMSQDINDLKKAVSGLGQSMKSSKSDVRDLSDELDKADKKIGRFKQIAIDTSKEIKHLIPSMATFFGIFKGAQIAQASIQMANYEQSFKNLSYQLGQGNSKTGMFLKNIYKVKAATGDTLANLEDISKELIKNRVVGEKALFTLTKSISFFSEATGASASQTAQLAGRLSRLGRMAPESIKNILTSIMRVQRAFGMTSEEVENLNNGILETTTLLHNMGMNASFIENFQKGTVKLAAAFASVGIEAKKATDLVEKLLDLDRIEENALLYSKLGISIQDAVAGNIDPEGLQYKLKELGREIANMPRPAGYALARQLNTNYADIIRYQNMDPTKAAESDKELDEAAKEQRTLFTRIEKFFSSSIGKLAVLFLLNPQAYLSTIVSGMVYSITSALASNKQRLEAFGDTAGKAAGEAVRHELDKDTIIGGMKANQGVASSSSPSYKSANLVAFQRQLNQDIINGSKQGASLTDLQNQETLIKERLQYLKDHPPAFGATTENLNKMLKKISDQIAKFGEGKAATVSQETPKLRQAWNKTKPWEQANFREEMKGTYEGLNTQLRTNQSNIDNTKNMINLLQSDLKNKRLSGAQKVEAMIKKDELEIKLKEFESIRDQIGIKQAEIEQIYQKLNLGTGPGGKVTPEDITGYQKPKGITPIDGEKGLLQRFLEGTGSKLTSFGNYMKVLGKTMTSQWFGLKPLIGMLKTTLITAGPVMLALYAASQILKHFQPLMEMIMPALEGIFEVLARFIAKPIKWIAMLVEIILGSLHNLVAAIYNLLPFKNKMEYMDIGGKLKEISDWEVGQKMDDKERKEDAKNNKGVVVTANADGLAAVDMSDQKTRDEFYKFWSGKRGWTLFGDKAEQLIEESQTTNSILASILYENTDTKTILKEEKAKKYLEEHPVKSPTLGQLAGNPNLWRSYTPSP